MIRKLGLLFSILTMFTAHSVFAEVFCVGERVVTDSHFKGKIMSVFPDDTVDILFDTGSTNNWPISRISPIPTSINGFSIEDRVVSDSHFKGKIVSVYPDGTVDILFDTGSTNNWPTDRITMIQTRINGFSVDERVVTDSHYKGKIMSVYTDGTVDILFDTGSTNNWPTSRITTIQTRINGFSVDERVVTDSHFKGKIVSVYADGSVDILFDTGSTNNWPTSRISRIQYCVGNGNCHCND